MVDFTPLLGLNCEQLERLTAAVRRIPQEARADIDLAALCDEIKAARPDEPIPQSDGGAPFGQTALGQALTFEDAVGARYYELIAVEGVMDTDEARRMARAEVAARATRVPRRRPALDLESD